MPKHFRYGHGWGLPAGSPPFEATQVLWEFSGRRFAPHGLGRVGPRFGSSSQYSRPATKFQRDASLAACPRRLPLMCRDDMWTLVWSHWRQWQINPPSRPMASKLGGGGGDKWDNGSACSRQKMIRDGLALWISCGDLVSNHGAHPPSLLQTLLEGCWGK